MRYAALVCLLGLLAPTRATGADDLGTAMQIGEPGAPDAGAPTPGSASQPSRAQQDDGGTATDAAASANAQARTATSQPAAAERSAPEWTPKLQATVKPASAHVGDPIEIRIVVKHRQDVSLTLPLQLELDDFSEISRDAARQVEGPQGHLPTVSQTYTLRVAAYKLGELTLPPIELTALGPGDELVTIATTAFPIKITSVMANEPEPKLKGAEPAVRVYRRTWWLLYTIGALAALGLIVLTTILIHRRVQARRRADAPPPPPIPPHVLALERLDQLELERLLDAGQYKQLYLELSEILREYIGRLWRFDALEMTSAEISAALQQRHVSSDLRARLSQMFSDWDLVKFAKYLPDEPAARAAFDGTRAFVHQTRQHGPASSAGEASPNAPASLGEGAARPADLDDPTRREPSP